MGVDLLIDVAAVLECAPEDLLQEHEATAPNLDDALNAIKEHWDSLRSNSARALFIKDLKRRFPRV